jgi:hypothetical protein
MRIAAAVCVVVGVAGLAGSAAAQQYLMMPDSAAANNRMVLFSPEDGSLVNDNYFALAGGTPIHAMQVANQIWVSEQTGDRISRWTLTGEAIDPIIGAMDNIRGMEMVGGTVYLSNGGSQNGSPGASTVIMFDEAGSTTGFFSTAGLAPSPFSVLHHQGGLLVGASGTPDDIHRFDLAGNSLGTFHTSTSIGFVEQLSHASNGDVLAAGFTTGGIVRFEPTTGAIISSFTAGGARGVYQLNNGNIIWSNSAGVHVHDVNTGASTNVYASTGGRYFDVLTLGPVCGTADFDGDGDTGTDADIESFFACLAGNCCATCWHLGADFDGDGDTGTDGDIEAFFRVLAGNPC